MSLYHLFSWQIAPALPKLAYLFSKNDELTLVNVCTALSYLLVLTSLLLAIARLDRTPFVVLMTLLLYVLSSGWHRGRGIDVHASHAIAGVSTSFDEPTGFTLLAHSQRQ